VSWDDATAYCQKLTEQERTAGRLPAGYLYRLPTDAEREYACRAGTTTRFSFGDALECDDACGYCALLDSYVWSCGNGWPGRVGRKLPNPWGLYDMHGNVAEWCQDWLDLPGGMVTDPQGVAEEGWARAFRGGGWDFWRDGVVGLGYAKACRSAHKFLLPPESGSDHIGFRAVLAPGQPRVNPVLAMRPPSE